MRRDFSRAEAVIDAALGRVFPAAQVVVRQGGETRLARAVGWLDPDTMSLPTEPDTLFDLASVTKLFVVTAFMTMVEDGLVGLDAPVAAVLPEFSGERPIQPHEDPLHPGATVSVSWEGEQAATVDAGQVTFWHLLTHCSGLPAWMPLFREGSPAGRLPDARALSAGRPPEALSVVTDMVAGSAEAARHMALTTSFAYPIGARTIYSDIGMILVGMAIERLAKQGLDEVVARRVTIPLGLVRTRYLPLNTAANRPTGRAALRDPSIPCRDVACNVSTRARNVSACNVSPQQYDIRNTAPTEFCAWRNRRIVGEVHDENAAGLGGIAGHAGLFSTAGELAAFGELFLSVGERESRGAGEQGGGAGSALRKLCLLHSSTIAEMTRLQSQDGTTRRGLGFALWSPDPEASGNPFSQRAFGHTGFTGTSLWIDPERDLVVAVCTNRVYYGRDAGGILAFRVALHRAIVEAL